MQLSLCDAGAMRLCAAATRLCLGFGSSSGSGSTAWPRYLALLLGRPSYAVFLRVRYAPAAMQLSLCDAGAMREDFRERLRGGFMEDLNKGLKGGLREGL